MVYIVAAVFALFCIGVIIFAIRVYREDKSSLNPKKDQKYDDDDDFLYRN